MPSNLKRPWLKQSRSESPPAVKRRAIETEEESPAPWTKPASHARIFSWNVNGVSGFLQKPLTFDTSPSSSLREFLRRHHWPELLCLQEVKISCKDEHTQRRLQNAANSGQTPDEPIYTVHFSLPRDRWNATGFNGRVHGVATLIRDDFSDHLVTTKKPDWDLEGRVLIHVFDTRIIVINGYWVNGTSNPYRNPSNGAVEGTRHDHKLRFHQHMLEEAQSFERDGYHVLLVGDMNVARHRIDGHPNLRTSPFQHVKNRADFNAKFFSDIKGLNAIDVFRELHDDARKYTYHPRGHGWGQSCDRVDMIIATRHLFESGAIVASDICDNPKDRGHSDHVPLWVQFDLHKLQCLPSSDFKSTTLKSKDQLAGD